MKKIVLILSIMLLTLTISAQQYELYKSYAIYYSEETYNGNFTAWKTSEDIDEIMIRVDLTNSVVEFDNKNYSKFHMSYLEESKYAYDTDGDKYLMRIYNGFDEDGLRCGLITYDYVSINIKIFILCYSDMNFAFYTNKVKL